MQRDRDSSRRARPWIFGLASGALILSLVWLSSPSERPTPDTPPRIHTTAPVPSHTPWDVPGTALRTQPPSSPQFDGFEPARGTNLAPGAVDIDVIDLGGGRSLEVARGELLIRFRPGTSPDEMRRIHEKFSTRVVERSPHHDVRRVQIPDDADLLALMDQLRRDGVVAEVVPNAVARGAGKNRLVCDPGLTKCTTGSKRDKVELCADLSNDVLHCGQCWFECGAAQLCVDGACIDDAPPEPDAALPPPPDAAPPPEPDAALPPPPDAALPPDATPDAAPTPPGPVVNQGALESLQWQINGSNRPNDWYSAWATIARAPDVVVAILDSGAAYEDYADASGTYAVAPDLACTPFVAPYDFVNNDTHANDDHQHGTHITSLIAADPDCGAQTRGYAPSAQIMPVKVLDANLMGTEMSLVNGIYHAVANGADIINMSLAFGVDYYPSQMMQDALVDANAAQVMLVAATGNVAHPSKETRFPAANQFVIAVASYVAGRSVLYSGYGSAVDIAGPGGLLDDVNVDGYPDGVLAQTFVLNEPTQFGYWFGSGTSQAAPSVTGLLALMLQRGTPRARLRDVLLHNTYANNTYSQNYGSGRIDPQKIIENALTDTCVYPHFYVNLVAGLESPESGMVQGRVAVQVVDASGAPAVGVTVYGRWVGSIPSGHLTDTPHRKCLTDADGICHISSRAVSVSSSEAVLIGFKADTVTSAPCPGSTKELIDHPDSFFRLTEQDGDDLLAAAGDLAASTFLAYEIDPASAESQTIFNSTILAPSYMAKSYGTGLGSSSMVLSFNPNYLAGFTNWNYDFSVTGTGLGSSSLIGYLSPTMFFDNALTTLYFGTGLGSSSLIFNHYYSLASPDNDTYWYNWGTGLGSSSLVWYPNQLLYFPIISTTGMSLEDLQAASESTAGSGVGMEPMVP